MTRPHDANFEEFVRLRRDSLVRLATMLCAGDPHRGEDAVQTALIKLYLAWPRITGSGGVDKLDAYARRAIVNATVDGHRWRASRREHSVAAPPERPAPDYVDQRPSAAILAALRELPARMRAAVVLRFFEDLDVAATALVLGCSEGTVKSQTARALSKLRDHLPDPAEHRRSTEDPDQTAATLSHAARRIA